MSGTRASGSSFSFKLQRFDVHRCGGTAFSPPGTGFRWVLHFTSTTRAVRGRGIGISVPLARSVSTCPFAPRCVRSGGGRHRGPRACTSRNRHRLAPHARAPLPTHPAHDDAHARLLVLAVYWACPSTSRRQNYMRRARVGSSPPPRPPLFPLSLCNIFILPPSLPPPFFSSSSSAPPVSRLVSRSRTAYLPWDCARFQFPGLRARSRSVAIVFPSVSFPRPSLAHTQTQTQTPLGTPSFSSCKYPLFFSRSRSRPSFTPFVVDIYTFVCALFSSSPPLPSSLNTPVSRSAILARTPPSPPPPPASSSASASRLAFLFGGRNESPT